METPVTFSDAFLSRHLGIKQVVETGKIEGVPFHFLGYGDSIETGDTYIAERNQGMRLLTCKKNDVEMRCIFPVEMAYAYDTVECFKIELMID